MINIKVLLIIFLVMTLAVTVEYFICGWAAKRHIAKYYKSKELNR